jgi:hypothetical protein
VITAETAQQQDKQDNNQDGGHYRSFPPHAAVTYFIEAPTLRDRSINTPRQR